MKKLFFLVCLMSLQTLFAATNEYYAVINGDKMTIFYDDQMTARGGKADWWNWSSEDKGEVVTAEIHSSFTDNAAKPTDMSRWFEGFKYMKSIDGLDIINTSKVTTMRSLFKNCESLESIDLSNFSTGNVTDMYEMFFNCMALTSLDVSSFNTSKVTNMAYMFSYCEVLPELDLSNFDTKNVTDMHKMFCGIYEMNHLDLWHFETYNVTDMRNMFAGSDFRDLNLTSFNTDNVTTMEGMFQSCQYLESLDLSTFGTANVTNFKQMFYNCNSLTTLDLSGFDTGKATDMEEMFYNCFNLHTLYIDNFTTPVLTTAEQMFYYCSNLERIYCDFGWSSGAFDSDNMFYGCDELKGYKGTKYDEGHTDKQWARPDDGTPGSEGYFSAVPEYYAAIEGTTLTLYFDYDKISRDGTNIDALRTSENYEKMTKIVIDPSMKGYEFKGTELEGFFAEFEKVTEIEGLQYLNTGLATSFSYMFNDCFALEAVDLSNWNTSKVETMEHMFYFCRNLTSIDLRKWNTHNVTDMDGMFFLCYKLEEVNMDNLDLSNVTNMHQMFRECTALTSVGMNGWDISKVENMSDMFYNCSSLESIDFSGVKIWSVTDMSFMFEQCVNLKSVDFGNNITYQLYYLGEMFYACSSLTSVKFGSGFATNLATDMSLMFAGCSSLEELRLGFETDNVEFFNNMFSACTNLRYLDIQFFTFTNAENTSAMFKGCESLETIICLNDLNSATSLSTYDGMFEGCEKLKGSKGTVFDLMVTDKTYARIDGGSGDEGYFSQLPDLYVTVDGANNMTFFCDWDITTRSGVADWKIYKNEVTKVIFDESVRRFRNAGLVDFFKDFKALKEFEGLDNLNTSAVSDFRSMFEGCAALEEIDLSTFDTRNAEKFDRMFAGCTSLKLADLSGFDISKAVSMKNMFEGCSSLETIACDGNWTSSTAVATGMFGGCTALVGSEGSALADLLTDDLTYARLDGGAGLEGYFSGNSLYGVFDDGSKLLTIYYDTKKSTRSGEDYDYYRSDAVKVTFDKSVKKYRTDDLSYFFYEFENMEEIENLAFLNTSEATTMYEMFYECYALKSLDLSTFDTRNVTNMNGMFCYCNALKSLDLSSFDTRNVTDMAYMFYECHELQSVNLSSFNTQNTEYMAYMFCECYKLQMLELGGFNTAKVTDMSYMFYYCSALKFLDISTFSTSKVTSMSRMFYYCTSLRTLDLTTFDTQNVTDMSSMFAGCGVSSLDLSGFNTAKVTNMAYMFCECPRLTSIQFGAGFDTKNVTDMSSMFSSCPKLAALDLSGFNTAAVTDMNEMFYYCPSLSVLDLSGFDMSSVTDINYMFSYNNSLRYIINNNDWTSLSASSYDMFYGCTELVGDKGTAYDEDYDDLDRAHPDGGEGNEGYFSTTAPEIYAVVDGTTMTLWFDHRRAERSGETDWRTPANQAAVTKLSVDTSFVFARPVSTVEWFANFDKIEEIENMHYLGIAMAAVTDMTGMFRNCRAITQLDLNGFNIASAKTLTGMFEGCDALQTIVCNINWNLEASIDDATDMFAGCTSLHGGEGTEYDAMMVDAALALPDQGMLWHGYFTHAGAELYTVFEFGTNTLTYYYDKSAHSQDGMVDFLPDRENHGYYEYYVKEVVIDPSFADYHPEEVNRLFYDGDIYFSLEEATSITGLEYLNTEKATDMSKMFRYMKSLKELDLSHFNTDNVENMSGMFEYCYLLESVNLKSFNTEKVTDMSYMFNDCDANLKSLDLSNFKTAKVENMNGMFYYCEVLESLDISSFNTENVTNMAYMFSHCNSLTNLDMTGFDTKNVTNMAYMFQSCPKLTTLKMDANKFNTGNVTDMAAMFNYCEVLPSLDVSFFDTRNVTDMNGMFANCKALTAIDVSGFDTKYVYNMNNMFAGCKALTDLDVSGFDTKNVTNMSGMFKECEKLNTIDVSHFNTDAVEDMEGMFSGCTALQTVDLHSFNTEKVETMEAMFNGCETLKTLDVSRFNTSKVYSVAGMFEDCKTLMAINIGGFDITSLQYAANMFRGCNSLESIWCENDWNASATLTSSIFMFTDCNNLRGGNGTAYNPAVTDKTYARPDGGTGDEGYFSKAPLYTVTFLNKDGGKIADVAVEANATAVAPEAPVIEGWTFIGWDEDITNVIADLTTTAIYQANTYEVVFIDNKDNTLLTLSGVVHGSTVTAPTELPAIEGYHHTGWTDIATDVFMTTTELEATEIKGDVTFKATYAINEYNVRFLDYDGTVISLQAVEWGNEASAPGNPTRDGYTFTGWSPADFTSVKADLDITAQYEINQYTVVFQNIKGEELQSEKVDYNATVSSVPEAPGVEGYHFTGWTDTESETLLLTEEVKAAHVKGDVTYKATYEINKYTVRFLDYDETVISTQSVDWGKGASAPSDPTREGWTFTGWSPADYSSVKADMDITAQYSKDAVVYTVTFVDWDDTKIIDIKVVEGNDASAPADPTRDGYKFNGWDKTFTNVTSDLTVKATYTILTFTVKFVDYDETVLSEQKVDWSSDATAPTDPVREGYKFDGWDKVYANVTSDLTVKATYKILTFTVTFVDYDETVLSTETVDWKEDAIAPSDPEREGYDFTGWDKEFTNVTSDLTVTAQYKKKEATAIDETGVQTTDDSRKFIENGILYIERNGIRYTIRGQRLY